MDRHRDLVEPPERSPEASPMLSSFGSEIRDRLGCDHGGRASDARSAPATWGVERATDEGAYVASNKVGIRLARYSDRDWSTAQVRRLLRSIAAAPATAP